MQGSVEAEQEGTNQRVRRPVMTEEDKRMQEAVRKKVYEAVIGQEALRNTIAFVFVHIFDAEDESEWDSVRPGDGTAQRGNNGWTPGTIQKIADYMELRSDQAYRDIRDVLERVEECARRGERYDGKRRGAEIEERPERRNIKAGSMDEQLVGDWIEQGLSLTKTTRNLNQHREDEGRGGDVAGRSMVYTCYKSLDPQVTLIEARKQCGGPAWAKAGHRWVAQKMIRLGMPIPEGYEPWDTEKPLPRCFDVKEIGLLSRHQIVAIDEVDKKVVFEGLRAHSSHAKK